MTDTTDCYSTLAAAKTYAARRLDAEALTAADDADIIKALQQATLRIDSLPLAGVRYESVYIENGTQHDLDGDGLAQVLEFPRVIDGVICDYDFGTQQPIVPLLVRNATIEESIAILKWGNHPRVEAQQMGVKQIQLGSGAGMNESYNPGYGKQILLSVEAGHMMRRYIGRARFG